ncbi:MAG: DUF3048 domain-containing protein [bacterium]
MKNIRKKHISCFIICVLAVGLIFILCYRNNIEIDNQQKMEENKDELLGEASPLSGMICKNYNRRPIAVVLAEDPITRPLSGLSDADLVFEIPVITGSITRMIAVYVCNDSPEIGSLRSARHDFISLTMGLDAILAHWGGSHFALDQLDAGVMDNLDAMANPYNAFYRKQGIPQPHDGFTSIESLLNSAEKLGYRLENNFEGYPHQESPKSKAQISNQIQNPNNKNNKTLRIGYSYPYNVEYRYNFETNSYLRWRAGKAEIDKNNNKQIEVKVVVIMRAFSRQIEGPYYNDLDIDGSGDCQIYQNGEVIDCIWEKSKNNLNSKLFFLDENGREIFFTPGQIWIEIVELDKKVSWQ